MSIVDNIQSLATQIGTDVKGLKIDKADKADFDKVVQALNGIAEGLKGGGRGPSPTPNENAVSDSFAQEVVKTLMENHIPYLGGVGEQNLEEFKAYATSTLQIKQSMPYINAPVAWENVAIRNDYYVIVTPPKYMAVKVDYIQNGVVKSELLKSSANIYNPTELSYQVCDYYGAELTPKVVLYLEVLKEDKQRNIVVTDEPSRNTDYAFYWKTIVDNNNYGILDFTLSHNTLNKLIANKAKELYPGKYTQNCGVNVGTNATITYTGNIKILKVGVGSNYSLAYRGKFGTPPFKINPKYIALTGISSFPNKIKVSDINFDAEDKVNSKKFKPEWARLEADLARTKTIIYKWSASGNKYVVESCDMLDEWLRTHPLETL